MLPDVAPDRSLAPLFDYQELRRTLHTWAGGGGAFGLPRITAKAREAEALLERPYGEIAAALRSVMREIADEFARAAASLSAQPARTTPTAVESEPQLPKPVILVCDDDPLVLSVIQATLEAGNMICRTADNGRLAFAIASHDRPDAIILDVNMPALDGFQVLEELRRADSTQTLKVMMLTARYDTEDITRGVSHGADDYMAKPFDPAALVERVRALLAS